MNPLDDEEKKLVDQVASSVVNRRMALPAVLALETMKPLSFLGSQALYFFEPLARVLSNRPEYRLGAQLLEDRDKLETLLQRIETLEADRVRDAKVKSD